MCTVCIVAGDYEWGRSLVHWGEIETVFILSNSSDKTQMSGYKGLAKINEPP